MELFLLRRNINKKKLAVKIVFIMQKFSIAFMFDKLFIAECNGYEASIMNLYSHVLRCNCLSGACVSVEFANGVILIAKKHINKKKLAV